VTRIDDVRKTIETTLGTLTPAKAQQLAKGLLEPDARKDQIAKTAGDLLEWSQKNRQKLRDLVRREIREQLEQSGVASRADLDALKKRVRELERAAGTAASGRRSAASASPATGAPAGVKRKATTSKSTSKRSARAPEASAENPAAGG
jgi:polyhydroxyalkanoate synthesis regulator phasin